jgi:hypothetical protein
MELEMIEKKLTDETITSTVKKGVSGNINSIKSLPSRRIGSDAIKGFEGLSRDMPRAYKNAHPAAKAILWTSGGVAASPAIYAGGAAATNVVLSHPVETMAAIGVVNDIFNESMPPLTPYGVGANIVIKGYDYVNP